MHCHLACFYQSNYFLNTYFIICFVWFYNKRFLFLFFLIETYNSKYFQTWNQSYFETCLCLPKHLFCFSLKKMPQEKEIRRRREEAQPNLGSLRSPPSKYLSPTSVRQGIRPVHVHHLNDGTVASLSLSCIRAPCNLTLAHLLSSRRRHSLLPLFRRSASTLLRLRLARMLGAARLNIDLDGVFHTTSFATASC
jgi:hypothetical protein